MFIGLDKILNFIIFYKLFVSKKNTKNDLINFVLNKFVKINFLLIFFTFLLTATLPWE